MFHPEPHTKFGPGSAGIKRDKAGLSGIKWDSRWDRWDLRWDKWNSAGRLGRDCKLLRPENRRAQPLMSLVRLCEVSLCIARLWRGRSAPCTAPWYLEQRALSPHAPEGNEYNEVILVGYKFSPLLVKFHLNCQISNRYHSVSIQCVLSSLLHGRVGGVVTQPLPPVAVGTRITAHPPRRSGRGLSTIRLLPRVIDGEPLVRPWVTDGGARPQGFGHALQSFPVEAGSLLTCPRRLVQVEC